jgi:hypothetical protein
MPTTYSIFDNTPYKANRLENIQNVLLQLPDNEQKNINPKHIRDAIYSIWENAVFKITTSSSSTIEYIGIDKDDIYNKIFIGKKNLLGNNIMDNVLLSWTQSDTDIFFFNNKSDSNLSNQYTKISILAGNNSLLYNNAPYIKSRTAIGPTFSKILQLDIGNNSGNINVYSSTNRVYINNIGFPKIYETGTSASNGSLLVYDSVSGSLYWSKNTFATSSVGNTYSLTSILGNPLLINGNPIELTDDRPIISPIGSVKQGKKFTNQSIIEVVREMLYTYIPPSCSLYVNPSVAEKGDPNINIQIGWIIYKKSDPILSAIFTSGNVIGFTSPAPINTPGSSVISSPPFATGLAPFGFTTNYVFSVTDSGNSNGNIPTTVTASATMNLVYPYFWGVNTLNAVNVSQFNSILGTLTKSVTLKSNKEVALSGVGYIYFAYPVASGGSTYGHLSNIYDENGSTVSSYTYSIYSNPGLTSPNNYWSNIPYYVYKIGPVTVGNPNPVNWTFNY